ncbi:type VI secretion system-associated protein TagF [Janthinobacterium sp. BJB1]|uniref:type VI secretion system-associated protein TagF n=1 Tax=Janthinobacterium sp. GW458P TaxID=1981504 RepID=UPI000A31F700|nr:type VI secretion system-associated protein TagF [Janthinobacterium sp. GW458P]MBE3025249.1 type VI secretion system-associated protein TagF [Janthinobacterium sp. GW458P]PHV16589.1 type VI secretion system-associated protein TagF [Janthinobacterium sp. BJB303]PJD00641.1 type VI secretion system-associated protein TagF [Janthinobacterium sp. BJB1]
MKRAAQQVRLGYFGKIPARGDFIKACDSHALVQLLDDWLAQVMTALTAAPRWKLNYDALPPLCFAFVGTRSRRAIAGRLEASSDQSHRRFPFMAMGALEVEDADAFLACSPLVLAPLWQRAEQLAQGIVASADPGPSLLALAGNVLEIDTAAGCHAAQLSAFLQAHTVRSLQAMLASPAFPVTVRELLLGLGLLLRPVRQSGLARLEKSLVLPLPQDAQARPLAASFWLHLVTPFLRHADVELALFLTRLDEAPALVIGFCGADPHGLHALIDPQAAGERLIVFDQLDWVDEQLEQEPALRRLSACLQQEQLSLRSACAMFTDTFA